MQVQAARSESGMSDFAWGLIGPGRIAHRFADAVHRLPGTRLVHVQGRDAGRAAAFAQHWTRDGAAAPRSSATLDALLADPAVQGVYIATPHAFHADALRACLDAGKPVLCEKPLVTDAARAAALFALARERGVFVMEAVWTRFLPAYALVAGWLREQRIGALRGLQSSFCFNTPFDAQDRTFDPAQAGGALLDIGIYNLTATRWVLQQAAGLSAGDTLPEPALLAHAQLSASGVDQRLAVMLGFPGGLASQFICGFDGAADNGLRIFGERGHIHLPQMFWEAREATLQRSGEAPLTVPCPFQINGFEYEINEAMRCIQAGAIESPVMPHAETLATLRWMDRLRAAVGVRYPFDEHDASA